MLEGTQLGAIKALTDLTIITDHIRVEPQHVSLGL